MFAGAARPPKTVPSLFIENRDKVRSGEILQPFVGCGFGQAPNGNIALTAACVGLLATVVGFVADGGSAGLNSGFAAWLFGSSLGFEALTAAVETKFVFARGFATGSLCHQVALP